MENFTVIIKNVKNNEKIKILINYNISMTTLLKNLSELLKYEVYSLYVNKIKKTDVRDILPNSLIIASDKFEVMFSEPNSIKEESSSTSIAKIKIKILFFGKPEVGKTSIILKYVKNFFSEKYIETIQMVYEMRMEYNNNYFDLEITDLGGSETFTVLYDNLIYSHNIFIVCICVESLNQDDIFSYCSHIEKIKPEALIFLIITKIDLLANKSINDINLIKKQINSLKNFTKLKGWLFFTTSSITNENIPKLFKNIFKNFYLNDKEIVQLEEDDKEGILLPTFIQKIKNTFSNYLCY